jgi:acyl-CoA synthetase (NDP forming)
MTARCLERLFRPRSIAVFGGLEAARVLQQCDRMSFAGEIWPVHPTRDTIAGRRCFRSVAELPSAPDAAFVGVNRSATIEVVLALAERGAGGVICYASGFREAESGAVLEDELVAAAGTMPMLGPNCYGLINYLDSVPLWPDQHGGTPVARGVAIIAQSSNIALNMTMQQRGLPIAYVATAGNQAQTTLADIASEVIEDDRVSAIGLHIEGIASVARFEALALRGRALAKPIVAIFVGGSEQAKGAALSHTASIAGSDSAVAAFFSRLGIPRLHSVPELLETLKLLHVHGALPGRDLCSMSCSGGEAALMADAALGRRVRFRRLGAEEKARVKATLSDLVAVENPLDYHTFIWAREEAMANTFSAMIGCGFDLSLLGLDFPRSDRCDDADWRAASRAVIAAAKRTGGRAAVVASLSESMPEPYAAELLEAGVAPLNGIDEALAAADAAATVGESWASAAPRSLLAALPPSPDSIILSEKEAKEALAPFGMEIPPSKVAASPYFAVEAAEALGYPVVVKALGLAHKTDVGGVRLNLWSAREVAEAVESLAGLNGRLLVERMITDQVAELLIGVVRDPQFGLLMRIAAGGVLVELLGDVASLLLPTTADEVRRAILSLMMAPLLTGYRGRPAADIEAAIAAALAIARFAEAHADKLEELDVNPLIVRPEGKGAVAVDALIRMRAGA